ncbi:hypothetical protein PUMCH_001574 [Australozyma saopauloensis]|uniref:Uncharacterized protein n=1 Tax=Australozyma saopauloensis TaxID=291208 RepID=A0AAX4H7X4_9ASCO|nr:hypothetical protein PUMCH_001574 [[Candida] saopauloensis]
MNIIMSSPARNVIDPLICSYSDQNDASKTKTASTPNNLLPKTRLLLSEKQTQAVNMISTSSISNNIVGNSGGNSIGTSFMGASGWTPFLSRTSQPEGILSHVSTPSSKMFGNLYKQNHNLLPLDFDCGSLNLTPFLAHNVNLNNQPGGPSSAQQNVNFTPLCDKSLHLADFFMDSPIRQTPHKVGAITPSKFTIVSDNRNGKNDNQLLSELSLKRSITLLDTPARQPFKKMEQSIQDAEQQDSGDFEQESSARAAMREITANAMNKTPFRMGSISKSSKIQTPAHPVSSPSTVIMSSVTKSPGKGKILAPPSPTPKKEIKIDKAEPVMGIFSERKSVPAPFSDSKSSQNAGKKSQRKQASGMNRFQIVFTDVHTLMNNKKKKGGNSGSSLKEKFDPKLDRKQKKRGKEDPAPASSTRGDFSPKPHQSGGLSANTYSSSQAHNFNTSMNTSREFSMMTNSTLNTTASNLTASDHSSFELMQGGLISTPNGKYLHDLLFDKFSPGTCQNSGNFIHTSEQDQTLQQGQQKPFMPPPKTLTLQQAAQNALRNRHQFMESSGSVELSQQCIGQPQMQQQHLQQQQLQQQLHQMSMIHPDLQNAHPGMQSTQVKPLGGSFQMSTPQQHNRNVPMQQYGPENQSLPPNKEQMTYLYQQMEQYQQVNVSNGGAYNTSPTQISRTVKGRRGRKQKK